MGLARLLECPTHVINGEISSYTLGELTKWLPYQRGEVTIVLDSSGGQIYHMLAMYDMIRASKVSVNIVAMGSCKSAAVTLITATDLSRRYSGPNTRFMTHPVGYTRTGEPTVECRPSDLSEEELRAVDRMMGLSARESLELQDRLIQLITGRTHLSADRVRELFSREQYFWPPTAEKYGIIGHVLEPETENPNQGILW